MTITYIGKCSLCGGRVSLNDGGTTPIIMCDGCGGYPIDKNAPPVGDVYQMQASPTCRDEH